MFSAMGQKKNLPQFPCILTFFKYVFIIFLDIQHHISALRLMS